MAEPLRLERTERVVTVTLDDGSGENRLSPEALRVLARVVEGLRDDEVTQAVVLTGAGHHFFSTGILNPAIRASFTKEQIVDLVRQGQGVLNIVPLARVVDALDAEILALSPRETATQPQLSLSDAPAQHAVPQVSRRAAEDQRQRNPSHGEGAALLP